MGRHAGNARQARECLLQRAAEPNGAHREGRDIENCCATRLRLKES